MTRVGLGSLWGIGISFFLLLSGGWSHPGLAQAPVGTGVVPPAREGVLSLNRGEILTSSLPNLLETGGPTFPGGRCVLQLKGPVTPGRRAALARLGVELFDYLPHYAYVVGLDGLAVAPFRALEFVGWVGRFEKEWKLDLDWDREDGSFSAERTDLRARGKAGLFVTLFRGEDAKSVRSALSGWRETTIHWESELAGNPLLSLTLPRDSVRKLLDLPEVQFVERAPDILHRNGTNRWIVQSDVSNETPFYDHGIRGEGQVVGVLDGQIDRNHCAFSDSNPIGPNHRKILAYNTGFASDFHGTHVAGTIAGDGGANNNNRGIAYLAKLVYHLDPAFTEAAIYNRLSLHHNQGARVHSNSWGDDTTRSYNSLCRGFDSFCRDFEESLVLLAATNLAQLKNPDNAKNILTVGASLDAPSQGSHCSGGRGPTADGRRKPEIFAPGCDTLSSSAGSSCGIEALSGTSMACPAVAGVAALVRQYYVDGYYPSGAAVASDGFSPSSALIKATLLNSAVDMTAITGYPSDREGWGRVKAGDAAFFAGEDRRLLVLEDLRNADGLTTGLTREYPIRVTSSAETLKLTLAFTDVPASAGTGLGFAAVNDLDLECVAPSGTLYKGNWFSNGASVPSGSKDGRNNVEQVHVESPETGIWTVRVRGAAVNQDEQGFALVVTGRVEEDSVVEVCGVGAVNAGCGAVVNVLTVNGSTGGAGRVIEVSPGTPIRFEIQEAPAQRGDGNDGLALIYFFYASPSASDVVELPRRLGPMCFGPPVVGSRSPDVTFNSVGAEVHAGTHDAPVPPPVIPDGGTLEFYSLPSGFGAPMDVLVQGVVEDACTQGRRPYSVSNGILIRVR